MGDSTYKAEHRKGGLCVDCSRPAMKGFARCVLHHNKQMVRLRKYRETHREYYAGIAREVYNKRKEKGVCPRCGRELTEDDEGIWCIACATFRKRG